MFKIRLYIMIYKNILRKLTQVSDLDFEVEFIA